MINGEFFFKVVYSVPHFEKLKTQQNFSKNSICCSPQAAGGVSEQEGRLKLDFVFFTVRDAAPARVGNDDGVGQRAQSIADDGHLHRVA